MFETILDFLKVTSAAQGVGLLAAVFTILCWQVHAKRDINIVSFIGGVLWVVHFVLLGAVAGATSCGASVVAQLGAVVAHKRILKITTVLAVLTYGGGSWRLIATGWQPGVIDIIPFLTFTIFVASLWFEVAAFRKLNVVSTALWLAYSLANHSIGGVLMDVIGLISMGIGYFRHIMRPATVAAAPVDP